MTAARHASGRVPLVWFIPLAIFTLAGALAALSPRHGNLPLFVLLFTVGAGAACACGGFWTGSALWQDTAAWLFIVGAGSGPARAA